MLRCIAHRSRFTLANQPVIETPFVFSVDESFVLAIEEDPRIARFYADVTKNRKPDQAKSLKHDLPIYRMALTRDGKRAATASGIFGRPGRVLLWNLQTAQPLANIPHDGKIDVLEFSPDSQVLTTVNDQNVKLWKLPEVK
jgi:WD40 repeat protein